MRSSWRSSGRLGAAVLIVVFASAGLSAHRLDEYLQAARISIDLERVEIELDLTPGIALAESIAGEIDRDASGEISAAEGAAYAAVVLGALQLAVDGTPLGLELVDSQFPTVQAMHGGEGMIRLRMAAALPRLGVGSHRLLYRNDHHPDIGVYLANALVPADDRVAITAQERDVNQRELTIAYELRAEPAGGWIWWLLAGVGLLAGGFAVRRFRGRDPTTASRSPTHPGT